MRLEEIGIDPASDLGGGTVWTVGRDLADPPGAGVEIVFAAHALPYAADYRAAIQAWFSAVLPDGHLVILVSHAFLYERRIMAPARRDPDQRRLYTPRVLLDEIEEALVPNSYRVRRLCDLDQGYDYSLSVVDEPRGRSDILLVLQKIRMPDWTPETAPPASRPRGSAPDYRFEPDRTRIETLEAVQPRRICALKLDHLGDFIMGLAPLAALRHAFPAAEITLAVGSWNAQMARDLAVADHVVAFDAFPRNSSEEEVDVPGKTDLLRAAIPGRFDLAIDLRVDHDTRTLLRALDADLRAGIGTRSAFPFLDIALPLDASRGATEAATETVFGPGDFASESSTRRLAHRTISRATTATRANAIVWGPYRVLRPGRYVFEPFIELGDSTDGGVLLIDIALDTQRIVQTTLPAHDPVRLEFTVEEHDRTFEFRVWAVDELPGVDFSFYGGRLLRAGADSVLHQSEYAELLVELVRMRCARGMVVDADRP